MSTKISIDYDDNLHVYLDWVDETRVFLELRGVQFTAEPGRITVAIPLATWDRIVKANVAGVAREWFGEGDEAPQGDQQ